MKMFFYAMLFMAYFLALGAMINDVNDKNEVAPSKAVIQEPCVLQDCCMHDGEWFLYDKPAVFDEEACEVMSAIFADQINAPIAAIAEFIDGVYVIHLD